MSTPLLTIGPEGATPTAPATLRDELVTGVSATNPNYTANLPGSLIEDIASTDVGAMVVMDQARVDSVNDLTPYTANQFVLAQQGGMLGIPQNTPTNTSVYVVFSGTVGFAINAGFVVSDGSHQYTVQEGGVVNSSGTSDPIYAVATQTGSWAVPVGSVTTVSSSLPSAITLTVTNPIAGVSGQTAETVESYRSRVIERLSSPAQGIGGYLSALVKQVAGVIPRLVSIQSSAGGWKVIVGGGDPYAVGYAIYRGILDLSTLKQSNSAARNVIASIIDGNDTYPIPFINPPQQTVVITTTWNTKLPGFTSGLQVSQLASTAIQSYINGIIVGAPINLLKLTNVFQSAVSGVLSDDDLTTLTFVVSINGVVTAPSAGTDAVYGDTESYFYCSATGAPVSQG